MDSATRFFKAFNRLDAAGVPRSALFGAIPPAATLY
jgi:hypothetical protein